MDIQALKVGRPLNITVSRAEFTYHLVSTVEAVEGRMVCVTLITGKSGGAFHFYPEDKVSIIYRNEDRLWQWTQVTGGIAKLDGDVVHTLTAKNFDGESYNRRESYRVYIGEETEFKRRVLNMDKAKEYRMKHPEDKVKDLKELRGILECCDEMSGTCLVKDLSETGVGLYCQEKLPADAELRMMVRTQFGVVELHCTPVRSDTDPNSGFRYFYGCRIGYVSNNIVKVLFNLQRVQLSKMRNRNREI